MKRIMLTLLLATLFSSVQADLNELAPRQPDARPVGNRTRAMLELQASGQAAAPRRPMSGPVANEVYQRYLKSFRHPIPDQYKSTNSSFLR